MTEELFMAKYLIVGAGRSGIASARMLKALGQDTVVFDGNENLDTKGIKEKVGADKIEFILGKAT